MDTIKSIFEELGSDLKIDAKLAKAIHEFERGFVNLNEENIEFFGGHLLGAHKMRFRPQDREAWFDEILEIDEIEIDDAVAQLKTIDQSWVRASDAMNLSCFWLAHKALTSSKLNKTQQQQMAIEIILVMQYKFLGSLLWKFFPYRADPEISAQTYAELSMKFALKKAGSWHVMLRQRAEELISPRSVHRRVFEKFDRDADIVSAISDTQNRLREIIKSMTKVFYDVKERGARIGKDRTSITVDGEQIILEKSKSVNLYRNYLHDVIGDKRSFVREELVRVITDMMHTMPPRQFVEVLEWISDNHRTPGQQAVEQLVDETLIHAIELMLSERELVKRGRGLGPLLTRLRALYMASRMANPTLLECRNLAETVVGRGTKTKNASIIASLRTGVQLYIVLRAMAMKAYQQ